MRLFLSTLLLALLYGCSCSETPNVEKETINKVDTIGVLWERVHHCSRLEVAEITELKAIPFDDESTLNLFGHKIPLPGERKIMIPIEVKMKVFVDLNFVTRNDISIDDSTINISLQAPKTEISSTRIDHEREQQSVSWFRSNFTEQEREMFIKQGIEDVKQGILSIEINNTAKYNTEKVLQTILSSAGFGHHVNVTFKDTDITFPSFKD